MNSVDLQYYRKINGISEKQSYKDLLISEMTQDYNNARENAIYRFDVLINSMDGKDIFVNGSDVSIRGVVDIKKKQSADTEMEQTLQVHPNLIKQGDYVKFKMNDTDELHDYIIKSDIEKKHGYDEGVFLKCNYIIKYMIDGVYNEQPCIVSNNTKYTLGIKSLSSGGITEADGMFGLIMRYDDKSKRIRLGQRFIVNDQAWQATQTDHTTVPNILIVLLGETAINYEVDDLDNSIANAFEHFYTISLNSTSQTLVETETYKIISNVTDKGVVITNPNVVYTSSDESIAKVDNTGLVTAIGAGNCIITATIGNVNATLTLAINAKPVTPIVSYSCDWSTAKTSTGCSLKTYMSSTVILKKTIDGVDDSTLMVNYTLDSIGSSLLSSGGISIARKTNNSFLVKNVNISTSKSFVMTFVDNSDGTVIATQTIQLTGM